MTGHPPQRNLRIAAAMATITKPPVRELVTNGCPNTFKVRLAETGEARMKRNSYMIFLGLGCAMLGTLVGMSFSFG